MRGDLRPHGGGLVELIDIAGPWSCSHLADVGSIQLRRNSRLTGEQEIASGRKSASRRSAQTLATPLTSEYDMSLKPVAANQQR
jgi:hypothetical protein